MATISNWIIESGDFSVKSELYLEILSPGQMIYQGRSLQRLKTNDKTNKSNYACVVRLSYQTGLKFQIRNRYTDNDNFLFLEVDFSNNIVKLGGYENGIELISAETSHVFKENENYSCELWTFNEDIYCIINEAIILQHTLNYFTDKHGFALNVVSIDEKAKIRKIAIHELLEQPEKVSWPNDLLLLNRELLKSGIESDIISMDDFKNKYRAWERGKDIGNTDINWHGLGYPIQKPSTETLE